MKREIKLRLMGAALALIVLVFFGLSNLEISSLYIVVLVFAVGYEYLVVRPQITASQTDTEHERH